MEANEEHVQRRLRTSSRLYHLPRAYGGVEGDCRKENSRREEREEKRIKMHYVHVATPCEKCNPYILQTYSGKKFEKKVY